MIEDLLTAAFPAKHTKSAVTHFTDAVAEFGQGKWDDATAKGGKSIEAALKAVGTYAKVAVPTGKAFKAGGVMDLLERAPKGSLPETIKTTIPRACRFAYEVASNRGARHDADEVDPSEMDARTVLSVCSWVLAEMVRFAQKGRDLAAAAQIVEGLTKRRYPFAEEIDGRHYADIGEGAPEKALVILHAIYPRRMRRGELIESLVRHSFKRKTAEVTVSRLKPYVDEDPAGGLRLRNSGLKRFDELFGGGQG